MKRGLVAGILLVVAGVLSAQFAYTQDKGPAPGAQVSDAPEILPEIDRLKSYAKDLKGSRDGLEQTVADLKLYAQRLEAEVERWKTALKLQEKVAAEHVKMIQDKDREIQALKAGAVQGPKKPN